jgi:hypothetical protein
MTLRSYMSKRRIFVAIVATVALLGIIAGGAAVASNQHAHTVAVHLAAAEAAKAAKAAVWKAAAPARAAAALTAAWKLGNNDANTTIINNGGGPSAGQSPAAWCTSQAGTDASVMDAAANLVASYNAGCMAAVKTDAVQIKGQQVAAAKAAAAAKVAAAKAAAAAKVAAAKAAAAAQAAAAKAAAAKAAAAAAAAQRAAAAQAYAHRVLATMSGNGIQNSAPFLVSASPVTATYTYDCSGFGTAGNFIADMLSGNQSDLGSDDQSIANALGMSGGATTTLYPANTGSDYYLSVNSECDWTVTVNAG